MHHEIRLSTLNFLFSAQISSIWAFSLFSKRYTTSHDFKLRLEARLTIWNMNENWRDWNTIALILDQLFYYANVQLKVLRRLGQFHSWIRIFSHKQFPQVQSASRFKYHCIHDHHAYWHYWFLNCLLSLYNSCIFFISKL